MENWNRVASVSYQNVWYFKNNLAICLVGKYVLKNVSFADDKSNFNRMLILISNQTKIREQ